MWFHTTNSLICHNPLPYSYLHFQFLGLHTLPNFLTLTSYSPQNQIICIQYVGHPILVHSSSAQTLSFATPSLKSFITLSKLNCMKKIHLCLPSPFILNYSLSTPFILTCFTTKIHNYDSISSLPPTLYIINKYLRTFLLLYISCKYIKIYTVFFFRIFFSYNYPWNICLSWMCAILPHLL